MSKIRVKFLSWLIKRRIVKKSYFLLDKLYGKFLIKSERLNRIFAWLYKNIKLKSLFLIILCFYFICLFLIFNSKYIVTGIVAFILLILGLIFFFNFSEFLFDEFERNNKGRNNDHN